MNLDFPVPYRSEDKFESEYSNLQGMNWTPSKMIARMGKEINDESSVYYWAYKVRSFISDQRRTELGKGAGSFTCCPILLLEGR